MAVLLVLVRASMLLLLWTMSMMVVAVEATSIEPNTTSNTTATFSNSNSTNTTVQHNTDDTTDPTPTTTPTTTSPLPPATSPPPSSSPSVSPSVPSPPPSASRNHKECLSTIDSLADLELQVADTDEPRTYRLCANSIFDMGTLDYNYQISYLSGQKPIPLRSNMHLLCGDYGFVDDSCVIQGGDVHVDGTNYLGVTDSTRIDNVTLEGLTFVDASKYMVWLNKAGSVTFKNCQFRGSRLATSPVLLDYFYDGQDDNTKQDGYHELKVRFDDCVFDDNLYGGAPRQPAVVASNSEENRLIFQRCIFSNNDMVRNNTMWNVNSFLIEANGPLTMNENCFENNTVGVSPVVTYSTEFFLYDNFGNASSGGICDFASHYDTPEQYDAHAPTCLAYDAQDQCYARGSTAPSDIPSATPTEGTFSPSLRPASMPSNMPSITPSIIPTIVLVDNAAGTDESAPPTSNRQSVVAALDQSSGYCYYCGNNSYYKNKNGNQNFIYFYRILYWMFWTLGFTLWSMGHEYLF